MRDGRLLVPEAAGRHRALPLVLALHGAGGTGGQMTDLLGAAAERRGLLVLAPDSRTRTWDVVGGRFGPDVAFIEEALAFALRSLPVDESRLWLAGFSDGASYAASLGVVNGDVFEAVVAYSPGFAVAGMRNGNARFFVSHGVHDPVLPVERCSRRLVPALRDGGHDVTYREFDGGHDIPPAVLEESLDWLAAP